MGGNKPDIEFLLTPAERREALKRLIESDNPIAKIVLEAIDKILNLDLPDEEDNDDQ